MYIINYSNKAKPLFYIKIIDLSSSSNGLTDLGGNYLDNVGGCVLYLHFLIFQPSFRPNVSLLGGKTCGSCFRSY
ncbi:hypothetical protein O6P43_026559 [Quillaja saponaria]|uniref:Uncharacterized protein n=1 Tax=Quillaja saponaria TaxID=32244 RepID=A0AAD7L3T1_QUISA|nr:hypothetical protein O6P43_026559 [Quillaja saponaria]